ncbi:MAG: hypothetical protein N3C13_05745 [Aquificaceae bacterium]|nr:hypothetical protein [Aquificaceae bacterium]MCX8060684.1 hypothetical protein [Aquificaceae bacterium]MDW8097623.1 hypothetical protein [Aquificaceae bacterium]
MTFLHMLVYYLYADSLRRVSYRAFSYVIFVAFTVLTAVGIAEYFKPEALEVFHAQPKDYSRLRLLTAEPSQAVLVFSVVFFLSFLLARKLYTKVIISLVYAVVLYFISSKGIFMSMMLSSLLLLVVSATLHYSFLILLFNFVVIAYVFFTVVVPQIVLDILHFTSFATRASGLLSAVYILLVYPFGLGYGTYIGLYPEIMEKVSSYLSGFFRHELNLEEVHLMIDHGQNIGAKATLPQLVMFNGIFGLLFFFFLLYRTYTASSYVSAKLGKLNATAYRFFTLTLFIQLAIGTEYNLMYIIWLYVAFGEVVRQDGWGKA